MKHAIPALTAALSLCMAQVYAQAESGTSEYAPLYYAIKGGFMQPDGDDNDSALNVGGMLGQPFHRNFSWEAELTLTIADGKVGGDDNWDITTVAGYGVFRGPGQVAFKGKAGLAYWNGSDEDDISLSTGVGLGIRAGKSGLVDLEFTEIDDSVDFISVGYILNYR